MAIVFFVLLCCYILSNRHLNFATHYNNSDSRKLYICTINIWLFFLFYKHVYDHSGKQSTRQGYCMYNDIHLHTQIISIFVSLYGHVCVYVFIIGSISILSHAPIHVNAL